MGENVEVISGVEKGDRLALPMEGQELAMRDGASAKVVSGGIHEKAGAASDTGDR